MQMREKVGKSRNTMFFHVFPMIWGSGGSKSRLPKAAGAEPSGQTRDEKAHAVVARSTFRSQNVQNTPFSDHFWKLRCRKSARRCGTKEISKSKCTKHTRVGPLLEVETSKKCTPLWREAHFEVKMYKTPQLRTTFGSWDVEKVHAVVARSTFRSQNVQNTPRSDHFWKLRCRKSARRCGTKHISKSKCVKHTSFGPLFEVEMSKKCTPLWREAHFQVKMLKAPGVRTTFGSWDVEKAWHQQRWGHQGHPRGESAQPLTSAEEPGMLVNRLVLASICPWSFHESPNTLTQVASHFAEVFDFIDAGRNSACGAVLVHCFEGKNRTWVERGFHYFSIKN